MKRFLDFFLEIGACILVIAEGIYQWREDGKKLKNNKDGSWKSKNKF